MVSVTTTPTVTPSRSRSPVRSAAALASGSTGQQRELTGVDVGAVDSRGGLHQSDRVLGDQRAALAREYPYCFGIDQLAPQRVSLLRVDWSVDDAALALGHHLAGDHHDVVVAQPRCCLCERRGEVVARPELRKAGDRKHFDRAAAGDIG